MRRSRRPDDIYYGGTGLGTEDEPSGGLAQLVGMAFLVVVALLCFPLLEAIIVNPAVRWGFLMVVLCVCSLALIWALYPRRGYRPLPPFLQEELDMLPGQARREASLISSAMAGSPFSQLHAYLELREMLVRRYMLLRHLPRAEAEARLSDPRAALGELQDEDLAWLLRFDFKRAYEPGALESEEGRRLVRDFAQDFMHLLSKLEALG